MPNIFWSAAITKPHHSTLLHVDHMRKDLAECPIIKQEFWEVIIDTLQRMGMKQPQHTSAFITLGRVDKDTVIDKHMVGVMFLACRCLYAELTRESTDTG